MLIDKHYWISRETGMEEAEVRSSGLAPPLSLSVGLSFSAHPLGGRIWNSNHERKVLRVL